MGEIVYKVHACILPEFDGLGDGSVYKCECGKLFELTRVLARFSYGYGSNQIVEGGWKPLAPKWFNEETQTVTPWTERFTPIQFIEPLTRKEKLIKFLKGKK